MIMAYVIQPAPATPDESAQRCECAGVAADESIVDRSATLGDLATLASVLSLAFVVFQGGSKE